MSNVELLSRFLSSPDPDPKPRGEAGGNMEDLCTDNETQVRKDYHSSPRSTHRPFIQDSSTAGYDMSIVTPTLEMPRYEPYDMGGSGNTGMRAFLKEQNLICCSYLL
jgi:hypothetical protein